MAGMRGSTREPSAGNGRYLLAASGFATTDLSVRFYDACQGGGAYEKKAPPHPFFLGLPDLIAVLLTPHPLTDNARRSLTAGAQRPSERGGVISPLPAFRTYAPQQHFSPIT